METETVIPDEILPPEIVIPESQLTSLALLKPHPRNYRTHPDNQIQHLMHSIREFGLYRNIVVAREYTILAGHGIVTACRRLDLEQVPAIRLDIDPFHPLALKLLAADNYLPYFAEDDDRALTTLLKGIAESDVTLLGTGFDAAQLAAMVMVTRPASEIADFDAAAEWVGMPSYESRNQTTLTLVLHFENEEDRSKIVRELGVTTSGKRMVLSARWPPRERDDASSVMFEG